MTQRASIRELDTAGGSPGQVPTIDPDGKNLSFQTPTSGSGGGGTGDTVWTNVTFQNSWVNFGGAYSTAAFRKDGQGFVHFKGLVKGGTIGLSTPMFTLPTGYRPGAQLFIGVDSNGAMGSVEITTAGLVAATHGSNVFVALDGISFYAEA